MLGKQAQTNSDEKAFCKQIPAYEILFVFIVPPTRESLVAIIRLDGVDDGVGARHFVPRHGRGGVEVVCGAGARWGCSRCGGGGGGGSGGLEGERHGRVGVDELGGAAPVALKDVGRVGRRRRGGHHDSCKTERD